MTGKDINGPSVGDVPPRPRPDGASGQQKAQKCYICRSADIRLQTSCNGYDLFVCDRCELRWIGNDVSATAVAEFYDQQYYQGKGEFGYHGIDYLRLAPLHRRNARRLLDRLERVAPLAGKRAIDVGCGFGFLLDEVKRRTGVEPVGLELSKAAAEYAQNSLHLDVRCEEIESAGESPASFQAAFMIGSIEHFIRPEIICRAAAKLVEPGGHLVITTIDTAGRFPYYAVKPPEHLFYFNHSNIANLLNAEGFTTVAMQPLYWLYDSLDVAIRLLKFAGLHRAASPLKAALKVLPSLPVLIPTNEMLVIARRDNEAAK